jgi:hypothetical protein
MADVALARHFVWTAIPAGSILPDAAGPMARVSLLLTPRLRGFVTTSYLRFMQTAQMEALLFQEKVRPAIGFEYGGGATYRPPLSDNIVLIGGIQAMTLGQGLKDIYNRDHLFAIFFNARFQF